MIRGVFEVEIRAVRDDRGDFGRFGGSLQRRHRAHRNAEQHNLIRRVSLIPQIAHGGFGVEALVITERDARRAAVAVVARIVQQRAIAEPPEVNGALQQLAARAKQAMRKDDRRVAFAARQQPAAQAHAVRGREFNIAVFGLKVSRR